MKIDAFLLKDHAPVSKFEVDGLSNLVVVAGPNGVGKSRMLNRLIEFLQNPQSGGNARVIVSATCDRERQEWGVDRLDTADAQQASKLRGTLQRQQKRGKLTSNAVYFDSSRQFVQVQPPAWSWDIKNPFEENLGWNHSLQPVQNRFQDTFQALLRTLAAHGTGIAKQVMAKQKAGEKTLALEFPDPLERFKTAFGLLLSPKKLVDVDLSNPQLQYQVEGGPALPITSLSSGEKEVVAIIFDLLLRNPEDCVIFFDEPELHLHPELSFRLLKTLETVGVRNQFVLCTHSSDIISSAIDHSVVFLARRPVGENQAISVTRTDGSFMALREMGQSLGVISLGRKIVLIEGVDRSIDRDTYGSITQGRYPGLVLAPSGARHNLISFSGAVQEVLHKAVWGIDFFMLADRDNSLPDDYLARLEADSKRRLRFLPRCHIENYFLDAETIATACNDLAPKDSFLREPKLIEERLRTIASSAIPIAVNRHVGLGLRSVVGELEVAAKGVAGMDLSTYLSALDRSAVAERSRVDRHLEIAAVRDIATSRWGVLEQSLKSSDWKALFPGKLVLTQFASAASINLGHFQNLYVAAARRSGYVAFKEVTDIFDSFDHFAA